MISKNDKNSDEYQIFIIYDISWYPYFTAILTALGVMALFAAILTSEIKWLIILPAVIFALYFGQHVVEKEWQKYKAEIKKSDYLLEDKCEYWKCSCGRLNPVGTGVCQCGKSAVNENSQNDKY